MQARYRQPCYISLLQIFDCIRQSSHLLLVLPVNVRGHLQPLQLEAVMLQREWLGSAVQVSDSDVILLRVQIRGLLTCRRVEGPVMLTVQPCSKPYLLYCKSRLW